MTTRPDPDLALSAAGGKRYFGTDGVRGVVGESLTTELVERLGRAFGSWRPGGEVLIGRDTRGSGPALEAALVAGLVEGGARVTTGGVLPTPAVALLAAEHAAVVSASHNPPEYNGVKFFANGAKLTDAEEAELERLLDERPANGVGVARHEDGLAERYLALVLERFGTDLTGLRIAVDCANGAYAGIGAEAFRRLGAEVTAIADSPDGNNINVGSGATHLALVADVVREKRLDLGVAFDGDGDRMLAVDANGEPVDGDQILAVLAPALGVELVAVTVMTNLGFHQLMAKRGIRVVTTPVGDRYVLEALRSEGGVLGGEQSGHVIYLRGHVTGDGLAAALLLCGALGGRPLADAVAEMPRYPQAGKDIAVSRRELTEGLAAEVKRLNLELAGRGRVLVRPSGTEPVVRVLAEAERGEEADRLCASIADLVRRELG